MKQTVTVNQYQDDFPAKCTLDLYQASNLQDLSDGFMPVGQVSFQNSGCTVARGVASVQADVDQDA